MTDRLRRRRTASRRSAPPTAKTETEPTAEERKRNRAVSTTSSRDLAARFDPKTSHMPSMEQTGDFQYDEGDRKARAAKATLDSDQNLIVLDTAARMWDATGSTTADRIRMDQRTGDFTAEGDVQSSRLPDQRRRRTRRCSRATSRCRPRRAAWIRQPQPPAALRGRRRDVAGRQPHPGRRHRRGPREAHAHRRRQRRHQPVGATKDEAGRPEKGAATPVLTVVRAAKPGLLPTKTAWRTTPAA